MPHARTGRAVYVVLEIGLSPSFPSLREQIGAPALSGCVRLRRPCPRSHFGLYDDFNPNSITLTSLPRRATAADRPPARTVDEATAARHLLFKAAFLP